MFKSTVLVASAACLLALAIPRAQAAVSCTEADWTKVQTAAGKIPDATKKASAMKELDMAKDMMAKKDMAACATHMTAANNYLPSPY
jgi:hypothetical protein